MKNLLISTGVLVLVCSFSLNGSAQGQGQGKGNQKKEQPTVKENQGKKNANHGQGQGQGQVKDKGQGQNKDKANPGKSDEHGNVKSIERKGSNNNDVRKIVSRHGNDKVYDWTPETFKDRNKLRNEGKVKVCHKFGRADEPPVEISISRNALKAHLGHGDVEGDCPAYTGNRKFSDDLLGRRRSYYNTLYGAQDQVVYSQSILDYALQRLTGARAHLVTLQSTNAPAHEIERRQAVVLDLENNVSLLEAALAATAGLLVAKLVD